MATNDDIFQGNDDESLLMHVIEKITSAQDFDIQKVPAEHRDVVAVITAQAIIDNGGFRYFFESHFNGDSDYQIFVNAYKNMGATESADAINQALMMFPNGVPPEELDQRQKYLDSIFDQSDDNKKKIEEMEGKILGKVENYSRVANYIRQNKQLFN
ncbi:MAG: DUF4375 domain-containing protein [Thiohalomonadales bacterium]